MMMVEYEDNLAKIASSRWLYNFHTSGQCFDIKSKFSSLQKKHDELLGEKIINHEILKKNRDIPTS